MKPVFIGRWLELTAQRCRSEWLFGCMCWLMPSHVTLSLGFGPFDLTADVFWPVTETAL